MENIINRLFEHNDIVTSMAENEIKTLYIILIIILSNYIALFIIKWFYLKNIKNKTFQMDEISLKENNKLKEL